METGRDRAIEDRWRFGHCYPMAVALADLLDWRIEALVVEHRPRRDLDLWRTRAVHAYVVDPDGNAFDAGGPVDRVELFRDMLGTGNCNHAWRDARTEAFDGSAGFTDRLMEIAGDEADMAASFMAALAADAVAAARGYVLPVHLPDAAPASGASAAP